MTILQASSGSVPRLDVLDLPVVNGLYTLSALEQYPGLVHTISTRSAPDGSDWNLSAKRGTPQDPPSIDTAHANRRKLAFELGISPNSMVGCQQVHGAKVALVGKDDGGRGMTAHSPAIQGVDALITATPGLHLLVLSADCPPVFLYDPVRPAIGLAHSGWKGTVGRIAGNVVAAMVDNFGSLPSDIVAAVGPGIGPCCYSIGPNVIEAVDAAFPDRGSSEEAVFEERDGLTYFSLRQAIRRALLDSGVLSDHISVEEVCTAHNPHTFYSHRGEQGQCGLFGAVLGLRAE